ncbi:sulfate reduction electron transfer complex DsrMKJOP subunit DsrM [Dehalobacterium formicoaceticum]|uniref:Sulfate reduction electron transfer complex DsrMKJOP subunit DsrM n=1 Tax=Dehalobacterium formicoaceticum TaxID=51515 RepID=A0ABT1Y1V9_9FIRM|nr:sulfate reduction electron transfer complex DsrMKJOP subunit DsrM [Dehalobacterium formicoaceticum]MCR6544865.1 sulfate reduction electron transfer complex DsrMKJOP subunit DsrM [Dehalobacterium formicoaceticum]
MGVGFALLMIVLLILIPYIGVMAGGEYILGVFIPYLAFAVLIAGLVYRIVSWAKSPVPYRIPTTCGQQKTHDWIKSDQVENPTTTLGVWLRMAKEVFLFRSLFRNTTAKITEKGHITYIWEKWLWLAALLFHYSFFIIITRHLRLFTPETPWLVGFLEGLDGFFDFGMYTFYLTDLLILAALTYLLIRRFALPMVRYVSLAADYFPLFLILSIAGSGVLMKYFFRADVAGVKELAMGLISFQPVVPVGIGSMFYIHLFLVCVLLAYFPFSKLMHGPGLFLSPTRNLANNSRIKRHINPWNYPVKVHTYQEYEEEFGKVMKAAGLPLDDEANATK